MASAATRLTMNDATNTADIERDVATRIIGILQGINGNRGVSRQEFRKWETALSLAAPHIGSEHFLDELFTQASATWPDPGLLLKVFLAHAINAQFEGQPPAA